ncbi:acyltransferase family protein [Paenibacillus sp. sgz500958]|uniref:acyltransferase family protein n=1 Tax=Paenibacillus sp. sgz500958 TaxID=3242475 RepID=UPI0036D33E0C
MEQRKYIGDLAATRMNNFDFLRFAAASAVIFSHAYPLSWGNDNNEPLFMLSGGQVTIGRIAVAIFFIISGFLITQSYDRSKSFVSFAKARILRIFPGLLFVLLLSAFVLGPLVSSKSVSAYFADPGTMHYLKNIFLHPMIYPLPGVFDTTVYQGAVNGSLWTLEFEFLCYILVAVLGLLRLLRKEIVLIFAVGVFLAPHLPFLVNRYYFTTNTSLELIRYFSMGMLFYSFRKYIPLHKYLAWLSTAMILISLAFPSHFKLVFTVFGTYLIMYLAFKPTVRIRDFAKKGDFSYGIYIYAFPVQQFISYCFGTGITPARSMLFSFPLALAFAVLSWHLVERNALKLKNTTFIPRRKQSGDEDTQIKQAV